MTALRQLFMIMAVSCIGLLGCSGDSKSPKQNVQTSGPQPGKIQCPPQAPTPNPQPAHPSLNRIAFVRENHKNAVLELPSRVGLSQEEYERLAEFANNLIWTNPKPCVECTSRVMYSDADYFSFGVYRSGKGQTSAFWKINDLDSDGTSKDGLLLGPTRLATYSRQLKRRLAAEDVFKPEALASIKKDFANQISTLTQYSLLPPGSIAAFNKVDVEEFRSYLNDFAVEADGIRFTMPAKTIGIDGQCLELRLDWSECKGKTKDDFKFPQMASAPCRSGSSQRFVYDRFVIRDSIECEVVTDERPPHTLDVDVEYPVGGFPATTDSDAVSSFVCSILTEGTVVCTNVDEAVSALRGAFKKACADEAAECKKKGEQMSSRFDQCKGRIKFMDGRYLSYQNTPQHDMVDRNGVFGFSQNRRLAIDDILKASSREAVRQLMRQWVVKDLRNHDYEDFELPDYAKDWPDAKTLENFYVDGKGITWSFDAGSVLIGGKGSYDATLLWTELKPHLVDPAIMPPGDKTSGELVDWALLRGNRGN